MGVTWTEEQQKVISLRGRNILVSAAAGSGKTAVLVQRILSKIMDKEHPVDIDKLLIMTFTRAAAGEMRERISKVLEQALYDEPDNEHLQRQVTLIHTAQITTIDGFCSYIIRNYFHLIGLDPGYRTADEGELKLLKGDVLKNLIEEYYASKDSRFLEFVECYASGKTDEGIQDFILNVYEAAMSHPYPKDWLEKCLDIYKVESVEDLCEAEWMKLLWKAVGEELKEAESLAREAKDVCLEEGGPVFYEEALDSDLLFIGQLQKKTEEGDYDEMSRLLEKLSFARLSTKKMPDAQETKKEQVKALREEEKNILKELGERYFIGSREQLLEMLQCCRRPMESLVELTLAFMERFAEKKREKNLLDFTDMEHFALKILMTRDEDGTVHMSQAAMELSEKYDEVLVDEYQDSNLVQELLTTCVSGWINDRKNIFMVGDVKQSIYRFRLARPELFMEKYKNYSLEDSDEQRIDLHKNFRSRPQVLAGVNYIFRQIMGEDLGGITYDDAAALYPGAVFPEGANEDFLNTEVLLIETDGEELSEEQGSRSVQELEALAIAQEIRRIVGKERVLDKETGEYRFVEYGDIAILLRTAYGWAEPFSQVLASKGIPSYTASKTGYFSALEIVTILNYLRVCDNPLQDIPMAGVLRSPIVGCTAEELAVIRSEYPEGMLYESVCCYAGYGEHVEAEADRSPGDDLLSEMGRSPEEELLLEGERAPEGEPLSEGESVPEEKLFLQKKLRIFLVQLDGIRNLAVFTPIHQLILHVLKVTGYGDYASALPGGEQRNANLHMLVEKAMDYEKTSYRGLFNFIRYIESLQKYEIDFGEVNLSGAGKSSVQIMTIHKSKGLEFPIVFAAGMGKQFNFQDMNAKLLIHPELGFGADAILPERRLIVTTLHKQMIRRELLKESLGEELRVLYVALTRAKEKLFMTGTISKLDRQMLSLARYQSREEELLPVGMRMKGKTYWSYVLPALARHRCMDGLYEEYGIFGNRANPLYGAEADFAVRKVTAAELTEEEILYQAGSQIQEEVLKSWDPEKIYDKEVRDTIEERFSFTYPYEYLREIPVKVSVSELKKRSYAGEYEKEEAVFFETDIVPLVPRFISDDEEVSTGAAKGTAYHRLMECLDYDRLDSEEKVKEQLIRLMEQKKLSEAEYESIRIRDVLRFAGCPLGKRMKTAALEGRLYREQPFVMANPASTLNPDWKGEETVLVQGIIDAYFLEDEDIILVDYKTDRVRRGEENRLIELYHVQLEDYAAALERMLGRKVREKYIYSFTLGKEILVE
ncbi:MAG: UvrD-helicase domain-containing protein [Eubacteriales bacterium]|nr:UvrD-helicase domain-containing protein [Eubacteriales bacterium]